MLQEMFGEDSVPKIFKGEKLYVTVDGKKANIDLLNLVSLHQCSNRYSLIKVHSIYLDSMFILLPCYTAFCNFLKSVQ